MDAGGVGIDVGSAALLNDDPGGVMASVLLPVAHADEAGAVVGESSSPHEARTLFSTLTVSSRNISESWSRYPGHALESRAHCVHSGCLLSHCKASSLALGPLPPAFRTTRPGPKAVVSQVTQGFGWKALQLVRRSRWRTLEHVS